MKICIDVDQETAALLAILATSPAIGQAPGGRPNVQEYVRAVLDHLVNSAADGVRRPGAWERGWVEQAFGGDWEHNLTVDPDASWRRKVRP